MTSRTESALRFAVLCHKHQQRKYGLGSYAVHLIEVADHYERLFGYDDAAICAAYLHDVVEDCDVKFEVLDVLFGDEVSMLVRELTEVKVEGNRATRKKAEVKRLSRVSMRAKQLKLCDLLSNAAAIPRSEPFWKTFRDEAFELLREALPYCSELEMELLR